MDVLRVLADMLWDTVKGFFWGIIAIVGFAYIFTGFGAIIAIGLLEPILLEDGPVFVLAVIGEVIIVGSWLFFLWVEVTKRVDKLRREREEELERNTYQIPRWTLDENSKDLGL